MINIDYMLTHDVPTQKPSHQQQRFVFYAQVANKCFIVDQV